MPEPIAIHPVTVTSTGTPCSFNLVCLELWAAAETIRAMTTEARATTHSVPTHRTIRRVSSLWVRSGIRVFGAGGASDGPGLFAF
jgi:hypothetical protein